MAHMLVRHKIADFNKWKSVYEEHRMAREAAGLKDLYLWRKEDDPNQVVLLFEVLDIAKAKEFSNSTDAKEKRLAAGVEGPPDIMFLSEN